MRKSRFSEEQIIGNLLTYAAVSAATFRLWLYSVSFQNKLIGWKNDYESRARRG